VAQAATPFRIISFNGRWSIRTPYGISKTMKTLSVAPKVLCLLVSVSLLPCFTDFSLILLTAVFTLAVSTRSQQSASHEEEPIVALVPSFRLQC